MTPQYAAGFFDGEGCVNCASTRNNTYVRILIVNTNFEVLKTFQNTWGGDINLNYKAKSHWKQAYTWRLQPKAATDFLNEILPFLIIKNQQAEAAIAFNNLRPGQGNKWSNEAKFKANEFIAKIKQCNKKGVEII